MKKYWVRFTYVIQGDTIEGLVNSERLIQLIKAADEHQIAIHEITPRSIEHLL